MHTCLDQLYIGLISIPGIIDTNLTHTTYRQTYREKLLELVEHANECELVCASDTSTIYWCTTCLQCVSLIADVDCMNDNNYGFTGTRACILLHVAKV